ncbi:MAG: hypothetical protein IPK80_00005 [Nannocystis sp.]|nr:hypothetical protein [Nannocystis sp.]
MIAAAVVMAIACVTQLAAIQVLQVSLVESLKRGIGMSMAVVVGRVSFAEPITAGKVVALALMLGGAGAAVVRAERAVSHQRVAMGVAVGAGIHHRRGGLGGWGGRPRSTGERGLAPAAAARARKVSFRRWHVAPARRSRRGC